MEKIFCTENYTYTVGYVIVKREAQWPNGYHAELQI